MNRLIGLLCLTLALPVQAVDIFIINNDDPGEGLNDPMPRMAIGGNNGSTLGEQRQIALQFAADLLGDRLNSSVAIQVTAQFNPQTCASAGNQGFATLGSAGPVSILSFPPGATPAGARSSTFYPIALANALAGADLDPGVPDIAAQFNSDVDTNACFGETTWYYGLDGNAGDDISFVEVAVHELIHGVGFISFTNLVTGAFPANPDQGGTSPDIYSVFIRDLQRGQTWPNLTPLERTISAMNDGNVVWDGPSTTANGAPTLGDGVNQGRVQLFAPAPMQSGSSISHWDSELSPNALMEPFSSDDVSVLSGIGLAACLLQDIGWVLSSSTLCVDDGTVPATPPPDDGAGNPGPGAVQNLAADGGGGGGGCVLREQGLFDPLLPLLVAAGWLLRRKWGRRWSARDMHPKPAG